MVNGGSIPPQSLGTRCVPQVNDNMPVVNSKVVRGYYRTQESCPGCGSQTEAFGDALQWCTGCGWTA